MKALLMVMTFSLSLPAFADYFSCHLKVGEATVVSQVAEYKVYDSKVESNGWKCEGSLDSQGVVTVALKNKGFYGEETAQGHLFATAEVRNAFLYDMPDFVASCTCGLE